MMSGYILLFLLDIKIENRYKQMFNVRLAGDYLIGKLLFTWLSLVMSLVVSCFDFRCCRCFTTNCIVHLILAMSSCI